MERVDSLRDHARAGPLACVEFTARPPSAEDVSRGIGEHHPVPRANAPGRDS